MRLFLSSYSLGNNPEALLNLIGQDKEVAVIGNAVDFKSVDERNKRIAREKAAIESLGLKPEELDLRDYFGRGSSELAANLQKYQALWIRGGNVFVLRRAMAASGFDKIINQILEEDRLVYAGYSAAACVLAPTLKGYSIVDDPNVVPEGYDAAVPWDGLGILDYSIEPHYKSDHPESADIDKEVQYLIEQNMPYRTLRDGESLIINGSQDEIIA